MIPLSITMVLIGVNATGYIGFTQHLIAVLDETSRAPYFVLAALVLAPFALGSYFAGLIIEHFGICQSIHHAHFGHRGRVGVRAVFLSNLWKHGQR